MDAKVTAYHSFITTGEHDKPSIQITWNDIRFKVKSQANPDADGFTELIHGVSGMALPGQLLAVMGSSGAGKTTLLNILSDRLARPKNTKVSGTVQANGQEISSIDYKSYVGYVMQDDVLLDTMTPRECLIFSANMRLRGTQQHRHDRVEQLLADLKLTSVADNRIGSELRRGLSGGERRRVSIAVELIVDPSVIFLDEPTSGLDSTNALNVMTLLDSLAKGGITVVATIHQPSIQIFDMFSKVILLAEGHTVYQGPPKLSLAHFRQMGFELPPLISEPDFYMKILHIANRDQKTEEEQQRLITLIANYKQEYEQPKSKAVLAELFTNEYINRPSCFTEFSWLFRRSFANMIRNPVTTYMKAAQTVAYAVLCIVIYNGMGNGQNGVQDRGGLLFFSLICMVQGAILNVILAFPIERALFLKEQAQSLYGVAPYFSAKILAEIPMSFFTPVVFGTAVYFGVGLNTNETSKYFVFIMILLLLHGIGSGIGLMIGSLIGSVSVAPNLGMLYVVPLMMFGGFFSNTNSIPVAFRWFSYFSPYRYGFQALCINEFTDLHLTCTTCPTYPVPPGPPTDVCVPCTPLKSFDFKEGMWESIWVLMAFVVGYKVLALLALKSRVKKLGS